jgi:tetratricopeptide (TPR) repeat protein
MGQYYKSLVFGNERILLYLLGTTITKKELEKKYEVSDNITAKSIADAVLIEHHHISKYFKKLKSQELIFSIVKRIKGKKRKQSAYALTTKGIGVARKIKYKFRGIEIVVIDSEKKSHKVKLSKVPTFLNKIGLDRDLTDLEIFKYTNSKGVLDVENITGRVEKYIDYTEDALETEYFVGRVNELSQLKSWIASGKSYNLIVIRGIAGIGKTTLTSKLINDYKDSKHLFWHSINNWDTTRTFLFHLFDFLSKIDNGKRAVYIDFDRPLELDKILLLLKEKLDGLNAIFILDDFHKSNEDFQKFIISMVGVLNNIKDLKMIMLTRYIIPCYDQREVKLRKTVAELEVGGLDYESSKKILRNKGLPQTRFKEIYNLTSGSPLLLEIIDSGKTSKRYIYEEIFSQLSNNEQKVMEIISSNRVPIPYDAFFIDKNIEPLTIEILIRKLLIRESGDGLYDTHDFIREFFYKRLSPHAKIKYHKYCADFNKIQNDPLHYLEAIFHYIKSFQYKKAIASSIKKSELIISNGLSDRFLSVLEEIPEEELILPDWNQILFLKGELCFSIGKYELSLKYYNQAIEVSAEIGNNKAAARAYCELGHIYEEQNLFDDAIKNFENSMKLSTELNASVMIAEAKRGIGRVHWRLGDYQPAERYYKECLEDLQNMENSKLFGALYIDLGNIYLSKYNDQKAIKYLKKAINYFEEIGDNVELARAYNSLGFSYMNNNKYKNAIYFFKKQIEISCISDNIRPIGYGLGNLSYCYAKSKKITDAEKYLNKAKKVYEKINNENILFQILRTEALICQYYHNWDKAIDNFQKSIAILKKLNAKYLLTQTLSDLGELYQDKGEADNAELFFSEAREVKANILKLK